MRAPKILLTAEEMPRQWYNLAADLPSPPPPPLGPDGQPVGPDALAPVFPMNLVEQEYSQERWIDIPEPVREIYTLWRPSPLYRAHRLEKALGTKEFSRLKFGVGRPPGSMDPADYVLRPFTKKERPDVDVMVEDAADIVELAGEGALTARARRYLEEARPLEALHLVEPVLQGDPANGPALEVKVAAHEQLLERDGSYARFHHLQTVGAAT